MSDLQLSMFQPLVGEDFLADGPDGSRAELRLLEAETLSGPRTLDAAGRPVLEGFNLIFEGGAEQALAQGLYTLSHPRMGSTAEVFMTPVVSGSAGVRHYEVMFNRLLDSPSAATTPMEN